MIRGKDGAEVEEPRAGLPARDAELATPDARMAELEEKLARYRELMGPTDPAEAAEGTIRAAWGTDVGENACHGSDAPETARNEIAYFFPGYEL